MCVDAEKWVQTARRRAGVGGFGCPEKVDEIHHGFSTGLVSPEAADGGLVFGVPKAEQGLPSTRLMNGGGFGAGRGRQSSLQAVSEICRQKGRVARSDEHMAGALGRRPAQSGPHPCLGSKIGPIQRIGQLRAFCMMLCKMFCQGSGGDIHRHRPHLAVKTGDDMLDQWPTLQRGKRFVASLETAGLTPSEDNGGKVHGTRHGKRLRSEMTA